MSLVPSHEEPNDLKGLMGFVPILEEHDYLKSLANASYEEFDE